MEKCCDACDEYDYSFRSGSRATEGAGFCETSIAFDWKSMEHLVVERSRKDADFLCISCIQRCGYGRVLLRLR
jgi:hypothetical protein